MHGGIRLHATLSLAVSEAIAGTFTFGLLTCGIGARLTEETRLVVLARLALTLRLEMRCALLLR